MFMFVRFFLGFMLVATSIFLILLVLIQRGRGGGLAGALGGMGGQSAFGTKAGDLFTKITIGVATFWILLCILSINVLGTQQSLFSTNLGAAAPESMEGLGTTEAVPSDEPISTDETGPSIPAPEPDSDASRTPATTDTSTPDKMTDEDKSSTPPEPATNTSQPKDSSLSPEKTAE
ncbi:MAG: preprotein translocase subunit SecG [Pirellulales bacterium]|jgi:preprotein translocase subunit SecG|nr:preprotein translocase subunit SecG [Pirellulales bacterium]